MSNPSEVEDRIMKDAVDPKKDILADVDMEQNVVGGEKEKVKDVPGHVYQPEDLKFILEVI